MPQPKQVNIGIIALDRDNSLLTFNVTETQDTRYQVTVTAFSNGFNFSDVPLNSVLNELLAGKRFIPRAEIENILKSSQKQNITFRDSGLLIALKKLTPRYVSDYQPQKAPTVEPKHIAPKRLH